MKLRVWNALYYPRVRAFAREGEVTSATIDGLVCDAVCAARSRAALAALPGVRDVALDFETGRIDITGAPGEASCQRAIDSVVVAKPLRRALDAVRRAFGRRTTVRA